MPPPSGRSEAPRPRRRGEPPEGLLRIATHNVNGLDGARLQACVQQWVDLRLDVVVVTETHASFFDEGRLQRSVQVAAERRARRSFGGSHAGYVCFWAHEQGGRGGVAVLVRKSLVTSGAVRVAASEVARAVGGRLLSVPLTWAGHSLLLVGAYFPSGDAAGQRQLITGELAALAAAAGPRQRLVLLGDFNFVEHAPLDRAHRPVPQQPLQAGSVNHHDHGVAGLLHATLPALRDVYRALHPQRRSWTYMHSLHMSRIDRVYVAEPLLRRVVQCSVAHDSHSDHKPVVCVLLGRRPPEVGPGLRRVRRTFVTDLALADEFRQWLQQQQQAAPQDQHALLVWWPAFKRDVARQAATLNRRARQALAATLAAGGRERTGAALAAAHAALDRVPVQPPGQPDAAATAAADAVQQARSVWRDALAADVTAETLQQRRDWLHCGERPSPQITAALRLSDEVRYVPGLRDARTGQVVTDGPRMATLMAAHLAGVSRTPPAPPQALEAEVMQAVRDHGQSLSTAAAASVGAAAVSAEEVQGAMRGVKAGKSPGVDGIPTELYRDFSEEFTPLLSRLFGAIGALQDSPPGFLDGAVVVLY